MLSILSYSSMKKLVYLIKINKITTLRKISEHDLEKMQLKANFIEKKILYIYCNYIKADRSGIMVEHLCCANRSGV